MFFYSQDDNFYKYLTEYGGTFTLITIQGWQESKNN